MTKLLFGKNLQPARYQQVDWLFIKILGLIYFIAFASFALQLKGLIGSSGILPATDFLNAVKSNFGGIAYWKVPTIFWLDSSDRLYTIEGT